MSLDSAFICAVSEIKEIADIVDLISEYVVLEKRGRNFWGCCPFHNEKTPSFSINSEKKLFYCFGCQIGGDIFKFLTLIENRPFIDIVYNLARRFRISLPQVNSKNIKAENERNEIVKANLLASDFFHACLLKTNYGKKALEYLKKRGINLKIIEQFKIGYAPNFYDKLTQSLIKRNIQADILVRAGLSKKKLINRNVDIFRDRIIIPIFDLMNRIVGFGGRKITDVQPKYLNTPDTELFSKRNCLYGLNIAGIAARETNKLIIVEGYFDVIILHSYGIKNTVGTMGTAFSARQAALASKFSSSIYFAYDNDPAGRAATLKAYDAIKHSGVKVFPITIVDAKDPDEYVRTFGKEKFLNLMNNTFSVLEFMIEDNVKSMKSFDLDNQAKALNNILNFFCLYPNKIEVESYLPLVSNKLKISEKLIIEEYNKIRGKNKYFNKRLLKEVATKIDKQEKEEKKIIRIFLENEHLRGKICEYLKTSNFLSKNTRSLWEYIYVIYVKNRKFLSDSQMFLDLDKNFNSLFSEILTSTSLDDCKQDLKNFIDDFFLRRYLFNLENRINMHIIEAELLEKQGNEQYIEKFRIAAKLSEEKELLKNKKIVLLNGGDNERE